MIGQQALRNSGEFPRIRRQFAGRGRQFLPREPILITALFPFGQILPADFAPAKIGGQHALRVGQ
jgi:hypothetical protein